MSLFADMRRWIGDYMKKIFQVDLTGDPLTSIQQAAIERNRVASEENCMAARDASAAIDDLLAHMEARKNGKN